MKYDLDAFFVACNAPGRSAYNRVERRMAPLSKELSGIILPHDNFGSHLDSQRRTVDVELEKKNFQYAGEILAELWSNMNIDSFPVIAENILPENSELSPSEILEKDQLWFSMHVRTSQYCTQIVKCRNNSCCNPVRSSYFKVIEQRFLPPPIPLIQNSDGLATPNLNSGSIANYPSLFASLNVKFDSILPVAALKYKILPYDLYCPSVQSVLSDRICNKCHLYFASATLLKEHKAVHSLKENQMAKIRPVRIAAKRQREVMAIISNMDKVEDCEWIDEDDVAFQISSDIPSDSISDLFPIVTMNQHFDCPWK